MRTRWLLLSCVLLSIVAFAGRPNAQGPPPPAAVLHAIGDLPGGVLNNGATTLIRDATRVGGVGGVIYAVGGAVTRQASCGRPPGGLPAPPLSALGPCNPDTPIVWRFDPADAPPTPTLDALPDLVANTGSISGLTAFDITPDAAFIASQARNVASGNGNAGVLVTRGLPPSTSENQDLNTVVPGLTNVGAAFAVSDSGAIVYGSVALPTAPDGTNQTHAVRIDTINGTAVVIPRVCPAVSLPGCPTADTTNFVAAKGTSANGNVAVGSSFSPVGFQRRAYRYVHGSGMTPIPLLPGGTFNNALAVSPDGNKVLVTGNANGVFGIANGTITDQVYVYTASTDSIERLGSPNSFWGSGGRLCVNDRCGGVAQAGGMTADGSVVGMNFAGLNIPGESSAYIHNANGWFHFKSVLAANDVDFNEEGWGSGTAFVIHGISPDGTLVFGQGVHNGVVKGFVAEFAPGALASFNSVAAPPEDPSLVGAWAVCLTSCDPANPVDVGVFTADGAYFHINGTGYERGHYTYDGSELTVTTLTDTNGNNGLSGDNGLITEITVDGNVATIVEDGMSFDAARRIVGGPDSIVGGWVGGNPTQSNSAFLIVFLGADAGLKYFHADEDPAFGVGSDVGTYTWDPVTGQLDFANDPGYSGALSPDNRQFTIARDLPQAFTFTVTRVIDPRTPAITSVLSATATVGEPFAYQITGTNGPVTFGAAGLPPGLGVNTASGLISGSPAFGTFDIRIEASNLLSTSAGVNRLTLTVAQVAAVVPGPAVVIPIPPEAGEPPPVTIEFSNVTVGGTITVSTIDPDLVPSAPDPPAGFSLGDDPVYYEITPSDGLTFDGPVEVCFSYAGVTFTGFPRLLHYDVALASWVDITLNPVDTVNQIICGLTSSFSPFAIAASALAGVGFHQPIEHVAGALNTAKGGSTVPLKFNVYNDAGVEITNPADILNRDFLVSRFVCDTGEFEEDVPFVTTGGTALRYDTTARQFIQNWKTPNTPGVCYLVKVTGDGLLISARFKLR